MDLTSESIFQAQADKFLPQNILRNMEVAQRQENLPLPVWCKSETQVNPAFSRAEFNMLQRFRLYLPTKNRGGDALKLFHLLSSFIFSFAVMPWTFLHYQLHHPACNKQKRTLQRRGHFCPIDMINVQDLILDLIQG